MPIESAWIVTWGGTDLDNQKEIAIIPGDTPHETVKAFLKLTYMAHRATTRERFDSALRRGTRAFDVQHDRHNLMMHCGENPFIVAALRENVVLGEENSLTWDEIDN